MTEFEQLTEKNKQLKEGNLNLLATCATLICIIAILGLQIYRLHTALDECHKTTQNISAENNYHQSQIVYYKTFQEENSILYEMVEVRHDRKSIIHWNAQLTILRETQRELLTEIETNYNDIYCNSNGYTSFETAILHFE